MKHFILKAMFAFAILGAIGATSARPLRADTGGFICKKGVDDGKCNIPATVGCDCKGE